MLLELLNQITLVEEFFEGEVGLVEDGVDRRDVGVAAKLPKHLNRLWGGPTARRRPQDSRCERPTAGVGGVDGGWCVVTASRSSVLVASGWRVVGSEGGQGLPGTARC